jgi:hypothetical protein
MLNRSWLVLTLCGCCALLFSACCGSLMCNAQKVAAAELRCYDELQVANQNGYRGTDRTLQVSGCGKQATVVCSPTNLQLPPKEKVRGQVLVPQDRLELDWVCHATEAVATQATRQDPSGS